MPRTSPTDHWSVTFICGQCAQHNCKQCSGSLCDCEHERKAERVRPEDRDRSTSVRAASAGLPTLGKKR